MPPVNKLMGRIVGWKGVVYIIIPYSQSHVCHISNCCLRMIWKHWVWMMRRWSQIKILLHIFCSADRGQQHWQSEFLCAASWGHCCSQHQRGALSCAHVPDSEACKYLLLMCFSLFVCAWCRWFINTSCSLIVDSSPGLNESADTSSPISEVSFMVCLFFGKN